jgi:HlyD family secretion protein
MNKKKWIVVIAIALLALLGFGGWQRFVGSGGAAEASAEETALVRRGTLEVTVGGTGSLAPASEVALAFLAGGQVAEVLVEEGQEVEAGQALVRLDVDELELEVARVEARLAAAEGQLAQLTAPPQPEQVVAQEANLQAMQGQLSAAVASRDQVVAGADASEIAAAEAQVAAAEMEHRAAIHAYDAIKEEGDRKEQARYDLWAAEVALNAAQTQLAELLAGADAEEVRVAQANVWAAAAQRDAAQAQLDLLLAGATEEQIQAAQATVDQSQVALDQARLQLEWATLTAPMAGTVMSLDVEPGQTLSPGQPILVLSDLSALEVGINLDETDVAEVAVGQETRMSLDAFPGTDLSGEVTYVAPVAQVQSGVVLYPVTSRLDETDLPVRIGMTADVDIATATREDVLIAPLRAIETEGERAYVWRLSDGEFERVEVTLGLLTDTEVEIVSGLAEGDVVSVTPGPTGRRAQTQLPGIIGVIHEQMEE